MKWEGYELLRDYLLQRKGEYQMIPQERQRQLARLASLITNDLTLDYSADLIFICTHNSRRSLMAQIWAQISAAYYRVVGVRCFSGGTEATAFNRSAIEAVKHSGVQIEQIDETDNPEYLVRFPGAVEDNRVFSKKYEDPPNPTRNFIAVMTCSDADEACPIVEGAASRFAITYDDPKIFDGTPEELTGYIERSKQIAREMLYLFSLV